MRFGYLVVLGVALFQAPAHAQSFEARSVEAIDGTVQCQWTRRQPFGVITGTCARFTPPAAVRLGEFFVANGKSRQIKVIVANLVTTDSSAPDPQWNCAAGASLSELPRPLGLGLLGSTWLHIGKCRPLELITPPSADRGPLWPRPSRRPAELDNALTYLAAARWEDGSFLVRPSTNVALSSAHAGLPDRL